MLLVLTKSFFFFKNKNKENCHDDVIYNYILGHITYGILLIKLCLAVRFIFTLKAYIDVDLSPKEFIDQTVPRDQNYLNSMLKAYIDRDL